MSPRRLGTCDKKVEWVYMLGIHAYSDSEITWNFKHGIQSQKKLKDTMKTILILFAAHLAAASPPTNSCNGGMVVPTCGVRIPRRSHEKDFGLITEIQRCPA